MASSLDVWVYVPNLIGYARVVCMCMAFFYATTNWEMFSYFYLAAFVGDVVDGFAARMFNQCSRFGGVLDMVTDRVCTCGLIAILSQFYPSYTFHLTMLIVLDIASHWFHVQSVAGHHKSKESLEHRNPLLRWYYSVYPLFGYCCVGCELFYLMLYLQHFHRDKLMWVGAIQIGFMFCAPAWLLKQLINVVQLFSAMDSMAAQDAQDAAAAKKK